MLSITSDYRCSTGWPLPDLRRAAAAGFTHLHWCHHWNDDFLYAPCEIDQIARWLDELHLSLLDLHASAGKEKAWGSHLEHERLAGVELVANRIDMAGRLGGDVIILHLPPLPEDPVAAAGLPDRLRRSLDALAPVAAAAGVRVALENGRFDRIEPLLADYGPEFLGLCYDSGHGNMAPGSLLRLEALADRLLSVHLHDNDGAADQHRVPFTGTVDWARLTSIIARSAYRKCLSLESTMAHGDFADPDAFLAAAFAAGERLTGMVGR